MGLMVKELLQIRELERMDLICGKAGILHEIKGVTIIEAPDIVRFIDGGELLLTGLYAFHSSTMEEFQRYFHELLGKNVSGIVLKNGRDVNNVENKISWLKGFAEEHAIPLMEMPFDMSFQTVMTTVMERIFNEEVTRLKYYKTTHDNFLALAFSHSAQDSKVPGILNTLEKLIGNPVAIFQQNNDCYAYSGEVLYPFEMMSSAKPYDPGMLTNYDYWVQQGEVTQYIVKMDLNIGSSMYLVVNELNSKFDAMNCIAIENAIIALQYEFSRAFAVSELERKFKNDTLYNLLKGNAVSPEELRKSRRLLNLRPDGSYRVMTLSVESDSRRQKSINDQILYLDILERAIQATCPDLLLYRDTNRIAVLRSEQPEHTQAEYRAQLREIVDAIQNEIEKSNGNLILKAGAGKLVTGIKGLPETYKEANEAYLFVDIAGEAIGSISGSSRAQIVLFSDMGIFKLLCELDDTKQLMEYIPESLGRLFTYNKPQKQDLIITLKTYLDHNQNLSKTAQDLFVHYKTAAYRMEKITKITGIDFNNANEVLSVRIGLVVYQMIENHELRNRKEEQS